MCSVLQCVAVCCSVSQCVTTHKVSCAVSRTGWRRPIGCLICIDHFPQKSPTISGSFAKRDPRLKAFYASSPPCTVGLMFVLLFERANLLVRPLSCSLLLARPLVLSPSLSISLSLTLTHVIHVPLGNEPICWRRPIGCFVFIRHFPQKSPIISGSLQKMICKSRHPMGPRHPLHQKFTHI